jgi:hypothetical protein
VSLFLSFYAFRVGKAPGGSWGVGSGNYLFLSHAHGVVCSAAKGKEKGKIPSLAISCLTRAAVKGITVMLPRSEKGISADITRGAVLSPNTWLRNTVAMSGVSCVEIRSLGTAQKHAMLTKMNRTVAASIARSVCLGNTFLGVRTSART